MLNRMISKAVRIARGTALALGTAVMLALLLGVTTTALAGTGHAPPRRRSTEMTNTRQTTIKPALDGRRSKARHRDPEFLAQTIERSRKMVTQEIAHRNFGVLDDLLTGLVDGGRESSPLLAVQNAKAALARTQEDAAIEAQDILSQADEAIVLG